MPSHHFWVVTLASPLNTQTGEGPPPPLSRRRSVAPLSRRHGRLVDGAGRPAALLDWGLLTTAGDSAFDAATASAFFDMYGPEAAAHHEALAGRLAETLGYDREWLLVQLAAYAVAGACAYDPQGRDGHFAWCVEVLVRADVRSALGAGEAIRGRRARTAPSPR